MTTHVQRAAPGGPFPARLPVVARTPGTPEGPAAPATGPAPAEPAASGTSGIPAASVASSASPAASASSRTSAPERPRADCTADSAGGLTFDVRLPGDTATPQDAALLLRRRGGTGPADTVRLPLVPTGADGPLRAALPSIMTLPEGRWDVGLVLGDGEPTRLLPGVHDLRSLVDRTPRSGRTWLGVRIPYATRYGNLSVRAWLRWPHAEAGEIRVGDEGMILRGRLYGAVLGRTARLEARPRTRAGAGQGAGAAGTAALPPAVVVPVTVGPGGQQVPGGDAVTGPAFTAELPYGGLTAHPVWDLWLRPQAEAEPVRVARILDDVADKKRIFTYPSRQVPALGTECDGDASDGVRRGVHTVQPYYTLDNDLSVFVENPPADAAEISAEQAGPTATG